MKYIMNVEIGSMKIKEQKIPKWFNGELYEEGGTVQNRFSGEEYELNNIELSMYDFVMGASVMSEMGIFNTPNHVKELRKGLDWFRQHNPKAYIASFKNTLSLTLNFFILPLFCFVIHFIELFCHSGL